LYPGLFSGYAHRGGESARVVVVVVSIAKTMPSVSIAAVMFIARLTGSWLAGCTS